MLTRLVQVMRPARADEQPAADSKTPELAGETLQSTEPPVLSLDAGGYEDTLGADGDVLLGGTGMDTADYSGAPAGVGIDMTVSGPQDTGGAGIDSMEGVTRVIGTTHIDTFTFSQPRSAAAYRVDGNEGAGVIDLHHHARRDVDVDLDHLIITIQLASGVATIHFQNVQRLYLDDALPTDPSSLLVDADPTVPAGGVAELRSILLGGDATDTTHQWTQIDGPEADIHDPTSPESTFTAPEVDVDATLVFELEVTEGGRAVTAQTMITVHAAAPHNSPDRPVTTGQSA